MKNLLIILFITIFSCSKQENKFVSISNITKVNEKIEISIKNYTDNNYFIINPQLAIYTLGGADMLNTEIKSRHYKSKEIDSIICQIYCEQCKTLLEDNMFISNYIVLLPKKTTTKILYQYDKNFDEKEVKYEMILAYNFNKYLNESQKIRLKELKKIFTSKKIFSDYELFIEEMK